MIHSHLDAVDCHIMVDGQGYNGVSTGVGAVNYGKNFGCTAAAILGSEV